MPETASNRSSVERLREFVISRRAIRELDKHYDALREKRKAWRAEFKSKSELALDDILRLTLRSGFLRAQTIARMLKIHSGMVEQALEVGMERGCLIRQQVPGVNRPLYEYSLSAGTRNYLLAVG